MLFVTSLRKDGLAIVIGRWEDSLLNCLSFMFVTFIVSGPMNNLLQIYLRNFIRLPSLVYTCTVELVIHNFHVV